MRRYGKWRHTWKRYEVRQFPYSYIFRNELRRMQSQGRCGLTNRRWDSL